MLRLRRGDEVAVDAVQIYGAVGVSTEMPIERFMRDAKLLQIVEGVSQIQRNIIANAVIGRLYRSATLRAVG